MSVPGVPVSDTWQSASTRTSITHPLPAIGDTLPLPTVTCKEQAVANRSQRAKVR